MIFLKFPNVWHNHKQCLVRIDACIIRVDELIKMMTPKDTGILTSQAAEQENVRTVSEQHGNDNEDVSSASVIAFCYGYGSSGESEED